MLSSRTFVRWLAPTLVKRCVKCGCTKSVPARQRKCKVPGVNAKGFKTGHACWGTLYRLPGQKPKTKPAPVLSGKEATQKNLDRLFKMIGERYYALANCVKASNDIVLRIRKMERAIAINQRRLGMTEEQIAEERNRLAAARLKAHQPIRGMDL